LEENGGELTEEKGKKKDKSIKVQIQRGHSEHGELKLKGCVTGRITFTRGTTRRGVGGIVGKGICSSKKVFKSSEEPNEKNLGPEWGRKRQEKKQCELGNCVDRTLGGSGKGK